MARMERIYRTDTFPPHGAKRVYPLLVPSRGFSREAHASIPGLAYVMTTFADLGLSPPLVEALTTLGYEEPTPIQARTIMQMRRDPAADRTAGNDKVTLAARDLNLVRVRQFVRQ